MLDLRLPPSRLPLASGRTERVLSVRVRPYGMGWMANDDRDSAFADLEQRIRAAKGQRNDAGDGDGADPDRPKMTFGTGLTVGIELVVGVVAGVGIGLALDSWFETRPFLTILLFLLGTAAGMLNAWRHLVRIGMVDPHSRTDQGGKQDRGPD